MNDIIEHEGNQPASMSMVQHLAKAEIDLQIATAHAYPRSLSKINKNVLSLVTLSTSAAEKCTYALPRGGKPITGPSIRLAEIVASQWGNSRIGARVVHVDRKEMYVEAEGIFHDLETNTATTARVRRRISDRNGRLFNDDMILVTGNAACSIAKRNAILGGVPEAIWGEAYDAALRTVRGDMKTLPERRDETFKAMAAFGLSPDQLYAILGVAGEKDFGLDQIGTLRSTYAALKNGETTVEELLKTIEADTPSRKPGQIAAQTKPEPKGPTPEEVEAEAKKQAEAKEQAAEIERLRSIYEELAGESASGRWGIPMLTQQIEEVKAEKLAASKAAQGQAGEDTAPDNGTAEPDPAHEEQEPADETPHDPDTGEVQKGAGYHDNSGADHNKVYNDIVNDLMDASDVDQVVDMYGPQIAEMQQHAPQLHTQLLAEIEAAKE